MGSEDVSVLDYVKAARRRLRERTLPTLTAALILQIRVATAAGSYDLRALSSAFGLIVLVFLALAGATVDAALTWILTSIAEVTRVRVRFGPAPAPIVVMPAPIGDDMLLDKRGRPLRGAPRAKRLAALERARAEQAALAAAAAAATTARVIELPAVPAPLVAALARVRAQAREAWRASARVAAALGRLVPAIPVPTLPLRWVRIVAVTTTMTFVFATALGTTGLITQQGRIALGASTTLTIIAGEVSARTAEGADFQPIADGALLRAGMTIRTGGSTYAVLTYFEGSTVSLEPNTTLVIEALEANPDGSTVISMQQQVGRTWHSVSKLLNPSSKYEVKTPTLTATVRGTAFEVGVEQDQTGELVSSIVTTEGAVGAAKPPTPAEPTPAEVIVPAGFQASARAAEPVAPPEPAPEPERKVTVTVGSSNAVVVDPLGRANGEKDGKLILQTPGAKVQKVDGKLVVTLPKLPDGKISTVIAPATGQTTSGSAQPPAAVNVTTVVTERGRGEARSEETVQVPATPNAPAVVTGVEVKKSDSARPAEVHVLTTAEKADAPAPKVAEPPKAPESPKPSLLPAPEKKDDDEKKEETRGKVSSVVDVFVKATLPPVSIEDPTKRAEEAKKAEERAKEEAAKREEERRRENEQRAEEARRAEARARDESARITEERRRAEMQAQRSPTSTPTPQGSLVQNILNAIAPGADESARRDAERRAEDLRRAEERAKEEAARLADERRKAEDAKRQDDLKRAEEQKKTAEQKVDEIRKVEEKVKQDAPRDLERSREIEAKAREQAQRLEAEKRREAERLLDEFRKAEEKARVDAAKQLEEQRKAEERAKAEAERRIEELRQAAERAKEEAARAAEERRREAERKAEEKTREQQNKSNFIPVQTIDPLPGRLGNDRDRGRSGR